MNTTKVQLFFASALFILSQAAHSFLNSRHTSLKSGYKVSTLDIKPHLQALFHMFLKCENTMSKGCSSPEILIKIIFHIHEVHHRLLMERAHSHWWYSGEHCCLVVTCFLALADLCLRATLLVQPATHEPGGEKRIHAEFPGMFVDKPQRYSMILFILYQC